MISSRTNSGVPQSACSAEDVDPSTCDSSSPESTLPNGIWTKATSLKSDQVHGEGSPLRDSYDGNVAPIHRLPPELLLKKVFTECQLHCCSDKYVRTGVQLHWQRHFFGTIYTSH